MEIARLLSSPAVNDDALDVLLQDHAAIMELFYRYERASDEREKRSLVCRIIRLLTVHMRIEEDLFYPALAEALANRAAIDESYVAHVAIRKSMTSVNEAVASVQSSNFDAQVNGLALLVDHHIALKEGRIFDQARASGLDLVAIGRQLHAYRTALQYRYDLDNDGTELEAYLAAPALVGKARPVASRSERSRSALAARQTDRRAKRSSVLRPTRRSRRTNSGSQLSGLCKGETI